MKYVILFAAALSTGACATVIRGTKETAIFESNPPGATVTAVRITENDDNPVSCVTPCKLELSRKRDFNVTFVLEGYKSVTAKLASVVTGGGGASFLGNALIGGVIGAGVDAGTGAMQDLRPNPMIANLEPLGSENESIIVDEEGNPAPPPEYPDAVEDQIDSDPGAAETDATDDVTVGEVDSEEGAADEEIEAEELAPGEDDNMDEEPSP